MGEKRNAYRILVRNLEEKRLLGRSRRRWVHVVKMNLGEMGCGLMDWSDLAQHRYQ
jgi:hypothetical protein